MKGTDSLPVCRLSIKVSSFIIEALMLIVFGYIIFNIVQHTGSSMAILIVMEVFLILIIVGTGMVEGVLQWPVRAWAVS